MGEIDRKIGLVQQWIEDLQRQRADDLSLPTTSQVDVVLSEILSLIRADAETSVSDQESAEKYVALERQVQVQTVALTLATDTLKTQINERESAAVKLRGAYNDLELHLREHIADHARLNQRLQEQIDKQKRTWVLEREERTLTEALRDTLATMSSTFDLDKILDHILDTVKRVTPYDGANVLFVESDLVRIVRQRGYGAEPKVIEGSDQRIPPTKLAILQQLIDVGKALAIPDTSTSPMWFGFPDLSWVNSNVTAPIRSGGKILGFLSLDSATRGFFTQAHADRLQTFADQAAIAIQNARLLDRAKRAAVLAERNRLANELHDTISQTLWSMSLITERLPELWLIDQAAGRVSLDTVHNLALNALEEMRTLLFELRPSTLADEKLGDLIRKVAVVIANRAGIAIRVRVTNQDPVPREVHFVLYRVVQEALNNISRHALATQIDISYDSDPEHVELTINDDGIGFDPERVGLDHLGLSIIKDRVASIGATIEIISKRGEGTLIRLLWIPPVEGDNVDEILLPNDE